MANIIDNSSFHKNFQYYKLKERKLPHIKIQDVIDVQKFYEFGEKIGQGSFGIVIDVVEKSNRDKKLAMKIVPKSADNHIKYVRREIQILKLIEHPHIVELMRVFESPRKIYLIMEKCRDLAKIYKEKQKDGFSEDEARKMIRELVEAVAYLHKYDVVHRDIKMENILLGDNPTDPNDQFYIKLTDFGLSIVKFGKGIDSMLSDFCGTLSYMSPELITKRSYSQQCDNWAIGVIFYMMLFGEYPFESQNKKQLERLICTIDPPLLDSSTKITKEARDLLYMLLMKNPVDRITATEILHHPWILNERLSVTGETSYNILKMMKEWKNEMRASRGGTESDWITLTCQLDDTLTKTSLNGIDPLNDVLETATNECKQVLAAAMQQEPILPKKDIVQRPTAENERRCSTQQPKK